MSYEQAFEQWKPILAKIPNQVVKSPKIPIKILCGEAESLSVTCRNDKTQLLKAGLDWQKVEDLMPLSNTLRHCEAIWRSVSGKTTEQQQWLEIKKEALALKKELLRHFFYAFHCHPSIKKKLRTINHNRVNKHLSHDLLLLANIAQKYKPVLTSINFDFDQCTKAKQLAHQLGEKLANSRTGNNSQASFKNWRDRVYTLLSQKMKEIRTCGKYTFHNDDKKYAQYTSFYYRKHYANNRK